jgi:hypothetical protein
MRTILIAALAALLQAAAPPALGATSCRATSGPSLRPLIELFTSEGCDSCPAADRWLAAQFPPSSRDPRAIALAFHVDYWDRLGWVDRFASHAYTERQYTAMRANRASFVYTPQVLLQGRDFPGWRQPRADAIDAVARRPARAVLTIDATVLPATVAVRVDAAIADAALRADSQLFVAYVDSGLVSEVKAGENRGKRLAHEHVVRSLQPAGVADADGRIRANIDVGRPAEAGSDAAIVAFVQRRSDGDVLQALGLRLDGC